MKKFHIVEMKDIPNSASFRDGEVPKTICQCFSRFGGYKLFIFS